MNWEALKNRELGEPKTPAEYLEAARRIVEFFMDHWDEFEDGDGETLSKDDEEQTKTDMFNILVGCCDSAKECISTFNKLVRQAPPATPEEG